MRLFGVNKAWTSATLQNGWVVYDTTSWPALQYVKDLDGVVRLRGMIKSGTTAADTVIATLPAGFRPGGRLMFLVGNSDGVNQRVARVDVASTGDITVQNTIDGATTTVGSTWLSLSGISFLAEA